MVFKKMGDGNIAHCGVVAVVFIAFFTASFNEQQAA
jgi:hypothetical protein